MDTSDIRFTTRQTAILTLAGVGFVSLIGLTLWLAVYSSRFVPEIGERLGAAAVYLGSVFNGSEEPGLSVVPNASSTIPFGPDTTATTTGGSTTPPATSGTGTLTPGSTTSGRYPLGGTHTPPALSGLPDLVANVTAVGYLATTSAESFVASSSASRYGRAAVKFTIKNIGTNRTGAWRFQASIPTQSSYLFQSQPQISLNPGESISYTLGFDQPIPGEQAITVIANYDSAVTESSKDNNTAIGKITIIL